MDIAVILDLIKDYAPSILTVAMLVITTVLQKGSLSSGLKTIMTKAEELKVSAEFKEVQDKMQGIMATNQELTKQVKELTDALNKIKRTENDRDNKEV